MGPLLLALFLAATGCPQGSGEDGPVDACTETGQQCRLGGGQLGVCTMDTNGEMRCAPQH